MYARIKMGIKAMPSFWIEIPKCNRIEIIKIQDRKFQVLKLEFGIFYLKNTSYPKRINVPITTIKKKILINPFPFLMANLAPMNPPNALQNAIGKANAHTIFPFRTKRQIEPKLVAKFTILALADA